MENKEGNTVVLTVADHDWNGFIGLARMSFGDEEEARTFLRKVDALIDGSSEPDQEDAAYWFILDRHPGGRTDDLEETSERRIPTQVAQRIARKQVDAWLSGRPDPNLVTGPIPLIGTPDI